MRGLSLLETVVATFLFTLVTVLVMNLFPSSLFSLQQAELKQRAERLCQSRLNEERVRKFSSFTLNSSTPLPAEEWEGHKLTPVLEVLPHAGTALKILRVTVTWRERNQTRKVSREVWITDVPR